MFGYVAANCRALSQQQMDRYRAFYCGICHSLAQNYSGLSRITVSYDMAFLVMLLSSLEEPQETKGVQRCPVHPLGRHPYISTEWSDYGADLSIILSWYNADDARTDGHKLTGSIGCSALEKAFLQAVQKRPEAAKIIKIQMERLREIETSAQSAPDEAAACFGKMLGGLCSVCGGRWQETLYELGDYLGRFIYMADASCDIKKDLRRGNYNPLKNAWESGERDFTPVLSMLMSECTKRFEILPIVQDAAILRNILYSGVWQKVNEKPSGKERNTK